MSEFCTEECSYCIWDSTILLTCEYTNVIVVHYNNKYITLYYNYDHTISYRHSRENRD